MGEWSTDGEQASETAVARRSATKEGGQLLPRRHPPQALSGSIVEKHLDPLEFPLADISRWPLAPGTHRQSSHQSDEVRCCLQTLAAMLVRDHLIP